MPDGLPAKHAGGRPSKYKPEYCQQIVDVCSGYSDGWSGMAGRKIEAVAYLRTSSATNSGDGKDSEKRQRTAIEAFARREGLALVGEFSDPGVSGADPIVERPGFGQLLDRIEANGVRVVIIEDASRFARELMTQELGILALMKRGVRVLTADGHDLTDDSDPSRKMMRQIAGAFAEYEKARVVSKLRAARERKRRETGKKVEGRPSHLELRPEVVALVRELRRRRKRRPSLRGIAAELARLGHLNERGRPFAAQSIAQMLKGGAA